MGEKGNGPQGSPTFPELCCHTVGPSCDEWQELIQLQGAGGLYVSGKGDDPFWERRSIRHRILEKWHRNGRKHINAESSRNLWNRGPGHTVGSENIYKRGLLDYKEKSRGKEESGLQPGPGSPGQENELHAMEIACDAVILLGRRYHDYALELAEKRRIVSAERSFADCPNSVVPAHRPETYWQAFRCIGLFIWLWQVSWTLGCT